MNPVVVQIASGNAFFIGLGLTIASFALRLWLNSRIGVSLLTLGWLAGISLVILSATPMSWFFYGLWFAFCLAVRIAFAGQRPFTLKAAAVIAFAVLSLSLCLAELPYRWSRPVTVSVRQPVYVLGDSISAGIGGKERVWPAVLGDLSHLKVTNLARAGATVETAVVEADGIQTTNALVIIEIGGNDLLGHTDAQTFYRQLDQLLGKLKQGKNRLLMFELPLLPFWNAFGSAQRTLAAKHGATLIPKRYLAGVFGAKGATLDGLHLSQQGHNQLAKAVLDQLRIEAPIASGVSR
ncbi:MAG TPA: GDSL-type esterase/lipase family protein [Candidatus Acidoferrum sp.]|nr:GDSL-type esterase/lipase family protein [Candidatus Acidoferrum sp.]